MELGKNRGKGSVFGSTLLIAGTCIGTGMLGLPVTTALAGFFPSVVLFFFSWLFMMTTGLLLLEVNLSFKKDVNLVTMADKTLGKVGRAAAWGLFLFLFYSIMVSYSTGSGELFADVIEQITSIQIPNWIGSIFFVGFFGVVIYLGTLAVDKMNRILMTGLLFSFFLLLFLGFPHIESKLLLHSLWSESLWAIPVMIVSFGYHNLIPSLTTYLDFDAKRMRISIIIGSALPLIGYLAWEALMLGLVPYENFIVALDNGNMVTHTLKEVIGRSWVVEVAQSFAFFAIVTSFIGVSLSFVDFLRDGLQLEKNRKGKLIACTLALAPPLIFGFIYPSIFINALKYAGAFGAVVLFGVLPGLMVWSGRYKKKLWENVQVGGGKTVLVVIILFGAAVFFLQIVDSLKLI